jgi:EamA domain-containing membrane protein RarD
MRGTGKNRLNIQAALVLAWIVICGVATAFEVQLWAWAVKNLPLGHSNYGFLAYTITMLGGIVVVAVLSPSIMAKIFGLIKRRLERRP